MATPLNWAIYPGRCSCGGGGRAMTLSLLACDLNTEPPNIPILMSSKHTRNPTSVRPMLCHLPRVSTSLITGMPQHTYPGEEGVMWRSTEPRSAWEMGSWAGKPLGSMWGHSHLNHGWGLGYRRREKERRTIAFIIALCF